MDLYGASSVSGVLRVALLNVEIADDEEHEFKMIDLCARRMSSGEQSKQVCRDDRRGW